MGLIKAAGAVIKSEFANQWREYFYCDALDENIIVKKGQRRTGKKSSNTKGDDNIISNGSIISVANGQCMIIVEQGKVVEICDEPGEFIYDSSTEPSVFYGGLGNGVKETIKNGIRRFGFGGDAAKDQRVYYFNTKELMDNKFGTPNPVPFRVVDRNVGLDIDVSVRCSGIYSYVIENPVLFYTNVCGNVTSEFTREEIEPQLKTEFVSALQPAFSKISEMEVRPSALPGYTTEMIEVMNMALNKKWNETRGIKIVSIAINSVTLPDEDAKLIKQTQHTAVMRNPGMAAATLTQAQAEAMKMAASNENGAMMGFMGMGLAGQNGGLNTQKLFEMNNIAPQPTAFVAQNNEWTCSCGTKNSGKFCINCGKPKSTGKWICGCGTVNENKFCTECGKPKPLNQTMFKCDKCGWIPESPNNLPKFCPECGDVFDEMDVN